MEKRYGSNMRSKGISQNKKRTVHKTVVRPAIVNGLETVLLSKRYGARLEKVELKMLRFSL